MAPPGPATRGHRRRARHVGVRTSYRGREAAPSCPNPVGRSRSSGRGTAVVCPKSIANRLKRPGDACQAATRGGQGEEGPSDQCGAQDFGDLVVALYRVGSSGAGMRLGRSRGVSAVNARPTHAGRGTGHSDDGDVGWVLNARPKSSRSGANGSPFRTQTSDLLVNSTLRPLSRSPFPPAPRCILYLSATRSRRQIASRDLTPPRRGAKSQAAT